MEYFSQNLKKLRKAKGYSQGELAKRVDLGYSSISSYERGKSTPPLEKFDEICKLLEVKPTTMIRYDLTKFNISEVTLQEGAPEYGRPDNVIFINEKGEYKGEYWPMLPETSPSGNKWYVYQITNPKMKPTAESNDYIICDEVSSIIDDSLYLLEFNDGHYAFNQVRRLYEFEKDKKLELIHHNETYQSHTVPEDQIKNYYRVYKILKISVL